MNANQNPLNGNNLCQDCKDFFSRIIESMPLFIKIVIFSTIILYLLNIISPYVAFYLADIPYLTIYYFHIWTLITNSFITTGIISIIFSLIFWYRDAVKLERQIGTVKYMLIFLMNSFCIQIIYCTIMFLIALIINNKIVLKLKVTPNGVVNSGLWPILMCDLTLLCLSNPEEPMKVFIFPCIIKAKYYPFILFLLFTIISGFNIDFEVMCAIGFGFLYHFYLKNRIQISNNFALKVENSFLFRWMKNKRGFINLGGVGMPELRNNLENVVRNVNVNGNNNNNNNHQPKVFRAFKGKGIAVGGGTNKSSSSASTSSRSNTSNDTNNNTNNNTRNNNNTDNNNSNNNNNNTDYNNISVSSSVEIMNSSDSRMDLNSSNPKS